MFAAHTLETVSEAQCINISEWQSTEATANAMNEWQCSSAHMLLVFWRRPQAGRQGRSPRGRFEQELGCHGKLGRISCAFHRATELVPASGRTGSRWCRRHCWPSTGYQHLRSTRKNDQIINMCDINRSENQTNFYRAKMLHANWRRMEKVVFRTFNSHFTDIFGRYFDSSFVSKLFCRLILTISFTHEQFVM